MLVRSAARRQRRHTSRALLTCFAQLNLPWLAPAQLRFAASHVSPTHSTTSRSRQRAPSSSPSPRSQSRQLATATDIASPHLSQSPPTGYSSAFKNIQQDGHVPWDLSTRFRGSSETPGPTLPHDPIVLEPHQIAKPSNIKIFANYMGSATELLQHLHTSIMVGRLPRARTIIQRLLQQLSPTAPEVVYAHATYLEELFKRLRPETQTRSEIAEHMKEMQTYFEVEVCNRGTPPDAKMLVLMNKASIKALGTSQRARSIRRYMGMAQNSSPELFEEVRYSEHYDDEEFAVLEGHLARVKRDDLQSGSGEGDDMQSGSGEAQGMSERALKNVQEFKADPLSGVDEVKPTNLRGPGLTGVKHAMAVLHQSPSLAADATPEQRLAHAYERQRLLEDATVEIAIARWRKADEDLRKIGISTSIQSRPMSALMWQWHQNLVPALEQELAEVKKILADTDTVKEDDRAAYASYLELLPLDKLAALTILHIMSLLVGFKKDKLEVLLAHAAESLGKAIERECIAQASVKRHREGGKKLTAAQSHRLRQSMARRVKQGKPVLGGLASTMNPPGEQILEQLAWPMQVHGQLGGMLIFKLIKTAQIPVTRELPRTREKVTQLQPAFLYRTKFERGNRHGILLANSELADKLRTEPVHSLLAKRMPMIVPPKPWTSWNDGGYLHYRSEVLRANGEHSSRLYFNAAHRNGNLPLVFAGLNALGQVPWKINKDVFKVQLEAWNSGDAIGKFAPASFEYEMPEQPSNIQDPLIRRDWLNKVRTLENKKTSLHSQRCYQNFQLEVARGSLNETLYFPHNLDFRGRAYPVPPYLNHMGADTVRALLVFAEGKPLGQRGLRWLKIHLATVAGFDKASLEGRVKFTDDHMEDIRDSAQNPLGGRRWWLEADDPWQLLAACFELTQALDSPDPLQFVSHLPIHQDGTCNGLQHYAALGGDEAGARQVNLEPGDEPSDIYTAVANAVGEQVRKDAKAGNPVAQKLDGHITRKMVKQPVMTNVYGVTFYGARSQVMKQLDSIFPVAEGADRSMSGHMAQYVTTQIFKFLGEMFTGARAIQAWLGSCATMISTSVTPEQIRKITAAPDTKTPATSRTRGASAPLEGKIARQFQSTVVWTTPLGLPVVQPYRKSTSRSIKTKLATFMLADPQVWDPVSKRKQLQAFAPNFIHSLDSSHMLLSAVKCTEAGLTFASIHDSFWSHACDVDVLGTVLRDAFIDLHSNDIVGRLRDEFTRRYQGAMYLAAISKSSPAGVRIMEWRKAQAASHSEVAELAIEVERLRLLRSANEQEREKGEAMVTPGSILAAQDHADMLGNEALRNHSLGTVPEDAAEDLTEDVPEDASTDGPKDINEPSHEFEAEDVLADSEVVEELVDMPTTEPKPKAKAHSPPKIHVWRPVEFPPVPQRGTFDVRRLRESKYFFS